jgi:hypothetical protein
MRPIERNSTSSTNKLVSVYYVVTIVLGAFVLFFRGRLAFAVDLFAVVSYLAVTAFFYESSKRISHRNGPMRRN